MKIKRPNTKLAKQQSTRDDNKVCKGLMAVFNLCAITNVMAIHKSSYHGGSVLYLLLP